MMFIVVFCRINGIIVIDKNGGVLFNVCGYIFNVIRMIMVFFGVLFNILLFKNGRKKKIGVM